VVPISQEIAGNRPSRSSRKAVFIAWLDPMAKYITTTTDPIPASVHHSSLLALAAAG
jgi:hypothetical protein